MRHHSGGLFVTDVNALHAQLQTGARRAAGRYAHHEEERVYAFVFETLRNDLIAADSTHNFSSFFFPSRLREAAVPFSPKGPRCVKGPCLRRIFRFSELSKEKMYVKVRGGQWTRSTW